MHSERRIEWVKRFTEYEMVGEVGKGRCRNTWRECVMKDLKRLNLGPSFATDREVWRLLMRVYDSSTLAWNLR